MDSDEIDEIAEEMDSESEEVQVKKENKVAPKEKPKSFKKPAFAGKTVGKEEKSKEEKPLPPKKKRKIVLGFMGDDSIAMPKSKKKAMKLMKKA